MRQTRWDNAAYERSNLEAKVHFNRCRRCKRVVCSDCFRILPDCDLCKECAEQVTGSKDAGICVTRIFGDNR